MLNTPTAFRLSCGMFAFPITLAKLYGAGQMLPWKCMRREAEKSLFFPFSSSKKVFSPDRFHWLFYFSPQHSHVEESRTVCMGGLARCSVYVRSQQEPGKRSNDGFCVKRGFSQPYLSLGYKKHLCQQKAEGATGVERGGCRLECYSFSSLLAYGGKCQLQLYFGFLSHPLSAASVTTSQGRGVPASVPVCTAHGPR